MNIRGNTTTSRVRVADRRTVEVALERANLTREEELVLRLRHGLALSHETRLSFRDEGASEDLRARLALMEVSAIEYLADREQARHEAIEAEADERETQSVIDRLRQL